MLRVVAFRLLYKRLTPSKGLPSLWHLLVEKRAVGPCGLALGILMQWKLRPLLASCIMQKELAGLV